MTVNAKKITARCVLDYIGWPWKATSAFNCLIINTEELFKHASSLGNRIVTFRFINILKKYLKRDIFRMVFWKILYGDPFFIQHCFNRHRSDSFKLEDAGNEPRASATSAMAVRWSNYQARSHPLMLQQISFTTRLDLIIIKNYRDGKKGTYATMLTKVKLECPWVNHLTAPLKYRMDLTTNWCILEGTYSVHRL